MKSMSAKFGVILLAIGLLSGSAEVWGADWRHYGTSDMGQFYYDKDSITYLAEGEVRVWGRVIKEEDLRRALEEKKEETQKFIGGKVSGKKVVSKEESKILYEQRQKEFLRDVVIAEKRMLVELKCGKNMFRVISDIEYDEKGNAKKGFAGSQLDWLRIATEAPAEGLYNLVCPKSK